MESTNPLILNAEHHYALDQIEHLKGAIFLTGKAGTGKSTLIQLFRKTSAKRVIFLAPTGVAAVQIKGQTIHSFFRFPPQWISSKDHRPIPRKLLEKTELIFIDEISMVRADLLDHIDQVLQLSMGNKKVFGGIPMLWTGDLFQLPPVVRADQEQNFLQSLYASPYFFSSKAFEKLEDFELLELHQVFRQSEKYFISLLDKIRMNEADDDDLAAINAQLDPREKDQDEDVRINLTSTNMASNQINSRRLEQLN
ncbi:MAG TPA: AAA family ATPase, partial [Saprospiraceae bacterium]|nr:AAA family ATPase [Saprospiraceae bacterium]